MKKRLLCFLLAAGMISVFPIVSFADDGGDIDYGEILKNETVQEVYDAHCFIRTDKTVVDENGNTHYDAKNYFPIGETSSDYEYGDNKSDISSVDATVTSESEYIPGAENIITQGNINIYNEFNADKNNIEQIFEPIYSNISTIADSDTISKSINKALGEEWSKHFIENRVKVLWYVIKKESDGVHIDGVLYWVSNGDVINKDDPNDPIPEPEPEPEPIIIIEDSNETDIVNTENDYNNIDNSPKTGDESHILLSIVTGLLIASILCGSLTIILKKN